MIFGLAGCGLAKRALPLPHRDASALVDGRANGDAGLPATTPVIDRAGPCDSELSAPHSIEGADGTFPAPGPFRPCGVVGGQSFSGLSFSTDGRRLVGIGVGGQVQVLDTATLSTIATLATRRGAYTSYGVSSDGTIVAANDDRDGEVDVWRVDDHALLLAADLGAHRSNEGGAVAVSPDGALVAATAATGVVIIDVASKNQRTLPIDVTGLFGAIGRILFLDGARKLAFEWHSYSATGTTGSSIAILDIAAGTISPLLGNSVPFGTRTIFESTDAGSVLVVGDGRYVVWDAATGEKRAEASTSNGQETLTVIGLNADGQDIRAIAWNAVSSFPSPRYQRRRVADGAVLEEWPLASSYSGAIWSPVGDIVALQTQSTDDDTASLETIDVRRGSVERRACATQIARWPVGFSRDGSTLMAMGGHSSAVFDVASGRRVGPAGSGHLGSTPLFSPDGRWAAAGRVIDPQTYPRMQETELFGIAGSTARLLADDQGRMVDAQPQAFSTDSRLLATFGSGAEVDIFDPTTARLLGSVPGASNLMALGFSSDRQILRLEVVGGLRSVRWADGAIVAEQTISGSLRQASADGSVVVTEDGDSMANIYRNGVLVATMPQIEHSFYCTAFSWHVAVSPDGSWAASTLSCNRPWFSPTGPITEIRDLTTGALIQSLPFDWGNVFSWDGDLVAHENTLWCR